MSIEEAIADFLSAKQAARRAPATRVWYEQQFRVWLDWLRSQSVQGVDWLRPECLDAFLLYEAGRGLKDTTVDARFRGLRAFFRWLEKRGRLGDWRPPTAMVDRPSVRDAQPRQADPADVERVLAAIGNRTWVDDRDRMIVELLRSTGLRVDEAVRLHVGHVDLREGFVYVAAGKGDKPRVAPFDERFRMAFVAYMFNRPAWAGTELLLAANGHRRPAGRLQANGVRQMMRRRCAAAGVAYINPHSLRHMFAIKALNDGVALSAVSAILGHSSVAFTALRYAKWVKRGLRREYDSHWQK